MFFSVVDFMIKYIHFFTLEKRYIEERILQFSVCFYNKHTHTHTQNCFANFGPKLALMQLRATGAGFHVRHSPSDI